jgi:hypothetical protein
MLTPLTILSASLKKQDKIAGNTILHILVSTLSASIVPEILQKDPSVLLIQNFDGDTPLHLASNIRTVHMCLSLLPFVTDEIWKKWEPRGFKNKTRNIQ